MIIITRYYVKHVCYIYVSFKVKVYVSSSINHFEMYMEAFYITSNCKL